MRLILSFLCTSLLAASAAAWSADPLHAITEDGRKVLLAPNGTWKFDSSTTSSTPAESTGSPYIPAVKKFSVAYDVNNWTQSPPKDGESPAKRLFMHKTLPLYAMVISDQIAANNTVVREVILHNVQSAGATPTIILEKKPIIDGKQAGMIRLVANVKGLDLVFTTNYYGDESGNIQVTCYTGQSLFYKYEAECQKFIDGLSIK
ncbi:hypothetical protein [Silvimonas iriomotensis]|uniref:DUF3157 family protein n=1 Tax=Silvimonas iriomotensis TaxID=449662 RepID=A0ABQ2P5B3_9NEIS|nr:hypothetical protein [Silvimonas iriomotensis]GGP18234.1 hypothetical protein GCM10010970_03850 [Silvimonas iriomotensis]